VQSRVFLIGLGSISAKYDLADFNSLGRTHARAVERHKDFILVGGYDPSDSSRLEFSRYFKKPAFENLEYGLKETNPDIVVIASPTDCHLENLKQSSLWSNPSIILCEKPVASSIEDANKMIQNCADQNIALFVNYFRNSEPSTFQIAEAVRNNRMQGPFSGSCTYNKGGLNTATHFLNLFELWFGEATEFNLVSEVHNPYNPQDSNIEFEANYLGGSINFHVDKLSSSLVFHSSIRFSNGFLDYRNEGEEIRWAESSKNGTSISIDEVPCKSIETFAKQSQYNVWNEISNFIHSENYNLCTAERATRYIVEISNLKRK